jgi:dTMP kinase
MYFAIEGVDCSGKSTQIAMLNEQIKDAVITKEPGATALGMQIRDIVLSQSDISDVARFLLFLADRAEHYNKVIAPALQNNQTIISDRSFISGMAYQIVNQNNKIDVLYNMNKFALNTVLPNKIIFLSINEEVLQNRLAPKHLDAIEQKGVAYLMQVQNAIRESLTYSNIEFLEIDGSLEPKNIHLKIMEFLC